MKDFLFQDLKIGDSVVFMNLKYKNLERGTIVKFTPQKVVISYHDNKDEIYQHPDQMVKIAPSV